jgi:DNA-directed RNA polymerase III subunit RPC6
VTENDLNNLVPASSHDQMANVMNNLLSTRRVRVVSDAVGVMWYILSEVNQTVSHNLNSLTMDEKVLYQLIENAGNIGIWINDLKKRSNLPHVQLNKYLKNLESHNLIKSVKSVAFRNKRVYMLYDLEPNVSVTGGPWYSDQEFDWIFIEVVTRLCHDYLGHIAKGNAPSATTEEITNKVNATGSLQVKLTPDHIGNILETLVYDGKAERQDINGTIRYRHSSKTLQHQSTLGSVPCGSCPVAGECYSGGDIQPATCTYLTQWLRGESFAMPVAPNTLATE